MENKLQELTQKIYSEGIEKAKIDALQIIVEAQQKADEVTRKAQKDAVDIIEKAKASADEIKRNGESEIRTAFKQAISRLKQQIIEMVSMKAIEQPVRDTLKDKQFVGTLIQKVAACFNNNAEIILPESDKDMLYAYFTDNVQQELLKGIQFRFDDNMSAGFKISPMDGNYIISFTDDDFAKYFKGFMRPKTVGLLFGEE